MEQYDGVAGDQPSGGGSFIATEGYGYEIFNFRPFGGHFYGFVESHGRIALERLGGARSAEFLPGVTVVFVAPFHGAQPYVIVGWYKNATVYRSPQHPPKGSGRVFRGNPIQFNLKAARKDGVLVLPGDNRVFRVPRGRAAIGQSRLWYADSSETQLFVTKVRRYLDDRSARIEPSKPARKGGKGWQSDIERRQLIETAAIRAVWNHFEALGYELESVEKENRGWDLEATFGETTLRLEVKGTTGSEVRCEVTPNEYRPLSQRLEGYRLCVVCDAVGSSPRLKTFAWSPERQAWCFEEERLSISELVGARLSA